MGELSSLEGKPILHVVFGMSAAGSIRQALRKIGYDDRVIGFPDDLSVGPIDSPQARFREDWLSDELSYPLEASSQSDQFWMDALSPEVSPVAWVCRRNALEYAGFLEFVSRVGEAPFWVVDASDIMVLWPVGKKPCGHWASCPRIRSSRLISPRAGRAFHRQTWFAIAIYGSA